MASFFERSGSFFRNVAKEMKRVSWPTRKELVRYTIITLSTVIFVAVFFALIDEGISSLIRVILG
ncbi:preprotein translocase subunit SecE [Pseudalkalibacillus caeni]|uniref:Protein translocase subunit SecE n=1 Tax=Exobacillus caeni TaxID=2574798 RepID=A0A5R9F4W9_9BACL|nr:preprotein translocase subunit SecE [Pseudalkalibacillus caeni]TLS35534.1 preprotein translocase subunit SecE [Pseudalkalibacillus caeni]